jgi:hypothetical protein
MLVSMKTQPGYHWLTYKGNSLMALGNYSGKYVKKNEYYVADEVPRTPIDVEFS